MLRGKAARWGLAGQSQGSGSASLFGAAGCAGRAIGDVPLCGRTWFAGFLRVAGGSTRLGGRERGAKLVGKHGILREATRSRASAAAGPAFLPRVTVAPCAASGLKRPHRIAVAGTALIATAGTALPTRTSAGTFAARPVAARRPIGTGSRSRARFTGSPGIRTAGSRRAPCRLRRISAPRRVAAMAAARPAASTIAGAAVGAWLPGERRRRPHEFLPRPLPARLPGRLARRPSDMLPARAPPVLPLPVLPPTFRSLPTRALSTGPLPTRALTAGSLGCRRGRRLLLAVFRRQFHLAVGIEGGGHDPTLIAIAEPQGAAVGCLPLDATKRAEGDTIDGMRTRRQRDRITVDERKLRRELDLQVQRCGREQNHSADQRLPHGAGGSGRHGRRRDR